MGFGMPIQAMFVFPHWLFSIERMLQSSFTEIFANICDGDRVDVKSLADGFVGPILPTFAEIGFQKYLGTT